jgi:large subunit ribosomal protein L18
MYAQLIDDARGHTLVAASTMEPIVAERIDSDQQNKTDRAKIVGALIGERAKALGIEAVVFDRGGFRYHGRVRAVAEGAREAGLKF